jgi:mannose-1-phosphate guanylyltransferase
VLNGDILTDADVGEMLRFHEARGAAATIYLFPVDDPRPYGLVELGEAGRVLRFIEKPDPAQITTNTINAGIYLLDRALLSRIPTDRPVSIEREFFPGLLADGVPFYGWVSRAYWLDIGSPAKYRQAQLDLLVGKVATRLAPADGARIAVEARVAPGATVAPPCVIGRDSRVERGARVGPHAVLGEQCVVDADARVEGSVLWDRVTVGPGAVLRDCVVGMGARIGARAVVEPGAVLAADAVVPDQGRVPPA